MNEHYTKHILDNGLTVYLKEIHTAPVISHWVWYRVGSRNELRGKTGLSHWVEHMQFKGTRKFSAETMDRMISRHGGVSNAFTYLDWTAFFETMPADKIDAAIELEADRMCNSLFDPDEVESERTVVISEREGEENDPTFQLNEAMRKAAFPNHPYRTEIIGETEDLYAITRDDLYNHYRTYYVPNNAVLSIAGDFDAEEMLQKLEKAYGTIPSGSIPEQTITPAAPIESPKILHEYGPCDVTLMKMNWHAPAGSDSDIFALAILDSVLSGPSSLNQFGQGVTSNRTSRFYRELIKSGLASSFGGGFVTTIDPYLYSISANVMPGRDPAEISGTVLREIDKIAREGISEEERAKALKQAKAMFAYSCENITNQAYWLGYASMFADPDWYIHYTDNLERVTAEDVSRLAGRAFRAENCVTGIFSNAESKQSTNKPGSGSMCIGTGTLVSDPSLTNSGCCVNNDAETEQER